MQKKTLLVIAIMSMCLLGGCGEKDVVQPNVESADVAEETQKEEETTLENEGTDSEEVAEQTKAEPSSEVVEETEVIGVEDPFPELPNDEWAMTMYQTTDKAIFIIFNDTTGKRKILEDGQEYRMDEGDELVCLNPMDWKAKSQKCDVAFAFGSKNMCTLFEFADSTFENAEIVLEYQDGEGNPQTATLYVSR